MTRTVLTSVLALSLAAPLAASELNLYSARHYDTDERLYSDFTAATGIKINRIEGKADALMARMAAEGQNSPADVLLTVDTSRLERAKNAGVLQAVDNVMLEASVPAEFQDTENQWFGFSSRARIIFYDKNDVANPPETYADLAKPEYKGMVCIRSGTNVYMQTILASIITHEGEDAATDWAAGVLANFARDPQGGDTDQLRGIVSGECDIALTNTYYYARSIRKDVSGLSGADNIGWVFPNQEDRGAHVNLSGGGIAAYAPNYDNAVAFLEYLASDQAQQYFAAGNDEYPVVAGTSLSSSVESLGTFKADDVDLSVVAKNVPAAQVIFNQVGWK
jgi:iron(III) transport system substrate-binding protein